MCNAAGAASLASSIAAEPWRQREVENSSPSIRAIAWLQPCAAIADHSMTRSGKLLAAGIAAIMLAIALLAYFATRPHTTLMALRDAAASSDYTALNRLIDFPSLRASVKAGLTRDLQARVAPSSSTGAQIGAMLGNFLIGPMVDLAVSPLGLDFILKGYGAGDAVFGARSQKQANPGPNGKISYETRWESPSRYAVVIMKNDVPVSTLTLRRYGVFEWKLAAIELPSWSAPPDKR
jgi:hypothetical protein